MRLQSLNSIRLAEFCSAQAQVPLMIACFV